MWYSIIVTNLNGMFPPFAFMGWILKTIDNFIISIQTQISGWQIVPIIHASIAILVQCVPHWNYKRFVLKIVIYHNYAYST